MNTVNMEKLKNKPYFEIERSLSAFLFPNEASTLSSKNINNIIDQGTTVHFEMRRDMGGIEHKYVFVTVASTRIRFEYDSREH